MKKEIIHTLTEFPVPSTSECEARVIIDSLTSPEVLPEIRVYIREEMFSIDGLADMWRDIISSFDSGAPKDITAVTTLANKDTKAFLMEYLAEGGGIFNSTQHARDLLLMYVRRTAYLEATRLLWGVSSGGFDTNTVLGSLESLRTKVENCFTNKSCVTLSEAEGKVLTSLQETERLNLLGKRIAVPTGFETLDYAFLKGLKPGNFTVLAARPGVGKTSVMIKTVSAAARAGFPVKVYSLEMTAEEMAMKFLYADGAITPGNVISGRVEAEKWNRVVYDHAALPIKIEDGMRDLDSICSDIIVSHQKGECGLAVIDYIGLVRTPPMSSLNQETSVKSNRLKNVAKDSKIPVLALCQLNRESIREGREPELIDLRESGAIEQDADQVIMLEGKQDGMGRYINMFIRKNRHGKGVDFRIKLRPNDTYSDFTEESEE